MAGSDEFAEDAPSDSADTRPSRWAAFRGRVLGLIWPAHPSRWADVPRSLAPTLITISRLTIAAMIAFLLTAALTHSVADLTGPLTAILVLQASAFSTLRMGLVRVGAVLSGVLVASALSTWIGLTWWSLGAVIFAALLLARVFRLGPQAMEAPISAMLILGVASHEVAAETRVVNTLIGAGVGVVFGLLLPTAMQTPAARRALTKVAEATAAPLRAAAAELAEAPPTRAQVGSWLDDSRAAAREIADAGERLAVLRDSRKLNPRALGTTDVEPVLSSALSTLERCVLAIRALFVALLAEIPEGERPEDPYGEELRQAVAVVLAEAGESVTSFGNLVLAEVEGDEAETERVLAESLELLRETQAALTELILVNSVENTSSWLLRGSILTALQQLLIELDLEDRARTRREWREAEERRTAQLPTAIRGALPHPERPYPRVVEMAIDQYRAQARKRATPYVHRTVDLDDADQEDDHPDADRRETDRPRGRDISPG